MDLEETILCPNCARQGQIFPNSSKRNQKLVEKVVQNQLVVITTFFDFQNPGLRIRRPQVQILPGALGMNHVTDEDIIHKVMRL